MYTTSIIQSDDISKIINEIRPSVIIDFRKKTEKGFWYMDLINELRTNEERLENMDEELAKELQNDYGRFRFAYEGKWDHEIFYKWKKYKYDPNTSQKFFDFIHYEIPAGDSAADLAEIQKLCKRIVLEYMQDSRRVLLVCYDGISTSGYIAEVCQWWYNGGDSSIDIVKELRKRGDYRTAKNKTQQRQIKQIMDYAKNIVAWKGYVVKNNKI